MTCPYCNRPAQWVENKAIYGRNYGASYMCWLCKDCDAYVGCHKNTQVPLGTMANKELREWRSKAHKAFDPLWKSGEYSRKKAYSLLSAYMGYETHIGETNIEACKRIIEFSQDFFNFN